MSERSVMKHGALSATRRIDAPRQLVFEAWTRLEHRKQWFVGPGWTELYRSVDLTVGGREIAHGRFPNGIETIYTARFHVIEPNERLIYAFDMQVGGSPFSVSLAGVEFLDQSGGTEVVYTEQGFFSVGEYDAAARLKGTQGLLDQFADYVLTLPVR